MRSYSCTRRYGRRGCKNVQSRLGASGDGDPLPTRDTLRNHTAFRGRFSSPS
ncbi:hypothetical protein NJ7G_1263 [Natrinema sp. J7-2]|nr:hypothetical protein NJ7G_1263 [Natrinema sp. J7-2]